MRLFVALGIAPDVCAEVLSRGKTSSLNALRWTPDSDVHITLKFLGETPENQRLRAAAALRRLGAETVAFDLGLAGAGFFPVERRPTAFWVGVKTGVELLTTLAERVESEFRKENFSGESRVFAPHVTLARARGAGSPELAQGFVTLFRDYASRIFPVSDVLLMESVSSPSGPRYDVRERFPLSPS